jgi:hypothetical protein
MTANAAAPVRRRLSAALNVCASAVPLESLRVVVAAHDG